MERSLTLDITLEHKLLIQKCACHSLNKVGGEKKKASSEQTAHETQIKLTN